MSRLLYFIFFLTQLFYSCSEEKVLKLKENGDEKITYYASKVHGYSIEIFKHLDGHYTQYALRLNGNGEIMYIYKTRVVKGNVEPVAVGPTWYLVSDTTNALHGAELFNREILGYYGSTEMNFIRNNNFRGKSDPFLKDEKAMILEVVRLMNEKKQSFIPFDSGRNLFWFKYDLQ